MNNDIKITYISKHVFELALKLCFTSEYEKDKLETVIAYRIHNNTMYLYSYISSDQKNTAEIIKFPYTMSLEQVTVFVWGWLENIKPTEEKPDTDGTVKQGFTITTDGTDWRGGSGFYGSFIAIKPTWLVYGK